MDQYIRCSTYIQLLDQYWDAAGNSDFYSDTDYQNSFNAGSMEDVRELR